jgi:hypothetical protein
VTVISRDRKKEEGRTSSTWKIDGRLLGAKLETPKEVKETCKRLNIDLSNLTTFLPEERVGGFARRFARRVPVRAHRQLVECACKKIQNASEEGEPSKHEPVHQR